MSEAFSRSGVVVMVGDATEQLREIETGSVQTVVTSPPYYGLRSYLPDAVKMRDDLTPEEREYVERELASLSIRPTSEVV